MPSTIKPFRGIYYNSSKIKSLTSVVCPPYDVIDKKRLSFLRKQSPYNFTHVILASSNNYSAIGKRFRQWQEKNVLVADEKENLYLYEQIFNCAGKKHSRYGVMSVLRMDKKGVFPHEYTLKEPKEDRKRMIREVKANLSPIFIIVPRKVNALQDAYARYSKRKPFFRFKDLDGNMNNVWKIADKRDISKICRAIDKEKFVIADGHHRFEVASAYYRNNKGRFKDLNYVLAHIVDSQKGLLILPTHRVVELREDKKELFSKLEEYFEVTRVSRKVLDKKLTSKGRFCFGIYKKGDFFFLRLKNPAVLDKMIKIPAYRKLDTYVLHKFVFSLVELKGKIEYTHSIRGVEELSQFP